MFERYTEKARRVIFFGRYEASQFGSPCIETEHLLLGLLREDKALSHRIFGSHANVELIRAQIEQHATFREKIPTNVDLPLSHECKRVLAFAAEEGERLHHKHVGTDHLLLGLLREENSFGAQLLRDRDVNLTRMREVVMEATGGTPREQREKTTVREALVALLIARQKQGGVTIAERPTVGRQAPDFALFAGEGIAFEGEILTEESLPDLIDDHWVGSPESENAPEHPAKLMREIQGRHARIRMLVKRMENAIANHEFEKARAISDQERQERELLRMKSEQLAQDQKDPATVPAPSAPPFLCIVMIGRKDSLAELRESIRDYIDDGASYVWLIDSVSRRAYTGSRETGLQELKGRVLRTRAVATDSPVIEIPVAEIPTVEIGLDAIFL